MTGKYIWDKIEPLNLEMIDELVTIKAVCDKYPDTDIPDEELREVQKLIREVLARVEKRLEAVNTELQPQPQT